MSAPEYIGPTMAQAALVDGAAWSVVGDGLEIAGKRLIGPAGKTFAFSSADNAARWVDNAKTIGARERSLMAEISPDAAEAWKERKRAKLEVISYRVLEAAGRQSDQAKMAALVEESWFLIFKWS